MKNMLRMLERREGIKIGMEVRFAELWDGDGDGEELLNSGAIAVWDEEAEEEGIVYFDVLEPDEDILKTLVRVTSV